MIRAAILALACATPAAADDLSRAMIGGDVVWLEAETADRVRLFYTNDAAQVSKTLPATVQLGAVVVNVLVVVGHDEETMTIYAPDGYVAIPEEIVVKDGETGESLIVMAMF